MKNDIIPHFIIFSHPRTGSTSLAHMLRTHPLIEVADEPFHESYTTWYPEEKNYAELLTDTSSLDVLLEELFQRFSGIKILDYQLSPKNCEHLLQNPKYLVIFLSRRNLLQAAVSQLIAEQTKIWNIADLKGNIANAYARLKTLPLEDIREMMGYFQDSVHWTRQQLAKCPSSSYIELRFEELYSGSMARRRRMIRKVFDLLGVDMQDCVGLNYHLDSDTSKINSHETYRLIPNIEEIESELGNDETGWLLKN